MRSVVAFLGHHKYIASCGPDMCSLDHGYTYMPIIRSQAQNADSPSLPFPTSQIPNARTPSTINRQKDYRGASIIQNLVSQNT